MPDLLDLRQLGRTFGAFTALRDVTITLAPGRVGLLGPNGAGKSTLLKIVMGLLRPTSGSGRVLDQEIGPDTSEDVCFALRRQIGFMPEADALIPGLTGIEYVSLAGELCGMPRRQAQRRAHEVLTYLEMEEARYRRVEQYSAGMKQRVKLAQAIVHDPPLILLDEPTSGLDPAGRDAMLRLLDQLGRDFGKSLIVSTHLLADVEAVCEQVVILLNGQVRLHGGVRELCARREDRYRLQVLGDSAGYLRALEAAGVTVLDDRLRGSVRVGVPEGWSPQRFFEVARVEEVVLRTMCRDDETLEELFLRTVGV